MRRAEGTQGDTIAVFIERLGDRERTVTVPKDSTVQQVLDSAGMTLPEGGTVWVDGVQAGLNDIVEHEDSLSITTAKKAGV